MAIKAYNAFAGVADMPNGTEIEVRFLDAQAVRDLFGYQPPGHPARKRVGWYWAPTMANNRDGRATRGPFTSSRKAMQDALKANGGDHVR